MLGTANTVEHWTTTVPTSHELESEDQQLLCSFSSSIWDPGRLQGIATHIVKPGHMQEETDIKKHLNTERHGRADQLEHLRRRQHAGDKGRTGRHLRRRQHAGDKGRTGRHLRRRQHAGDKGRTGRHLRRRQHPGDKGRTGRHLRRRQHPGDKGRTGRHLRRRVNMNC
uniref:Uncharacterized protein n=1 Tax=Denticeps clupeoides TaxID=299321 RepID=A0AAY4AWR8_9TELE